MSDYVIVRFHDAAGAHDEPIGPRWRVGPGPDCERCGREDQTSTRFGRTLCRTCSMIQHYNGED